MQPYPKIQTIFKRDLSLKNKPLILGEWSLSEFEYLAENGWLFTEKVDGTNVRVMFDGEKLIFGGRTDNAQLPAPLVARLTELFFPQINDLTKIFPDGVCFYGEGYGPKIQNGGKYSDHQDFVLFDIKIGDWWLERGNVELIAKEFMLDIVPVVATGTLYDAIEYAQTGTMMKSAWGNFTSEGFVCRPLLDLYTRSGKRIITKIKGCDFKNMKG